MWMTFQSLFDSSEIKSSKTKLNPYPKNFHIFINLSFQECKIFISFSVSGNRSRNFMKSVPELQISCVHWTPKDTLDLYTARKQKQVPNSSCNLNCTQTHKFSSGIFHFIQDYLVQHEKLLTLQESLSQLYKSDFYRILLIRMKRTPPTSEWPLGTHLLLPFVFGFLANKEGSSASRDLPLVLKSLCARSSRVLWRSREEMSPNHSFTLPENYLNSCNKILNLAFKRSWDFLLSLSSFLKPNSSIQKTSVQDTFQNSIIAVSPDWFSMFCLSNIIKVILA